MIKIEKDHIGFSCQICGVGGNNTYNITLQSERFGVELHLCRDCCKDLRNLLKFTRRDGVNMVSIDDIDK